MRDDRPGERPRRGGHATPRSRTRCGNIRGRITVRIAATAKDRPLRPGLPLVPLADTDRVEIRNFEAAPRRRQALGGRRLGAGRRHPATAGWR